MSDANELIALLEIRKAYTQHEVRVIISALSQYRARAEELDAEIARLKAEVERLKGKIKRMRDIIKQQQYKNAWLDSMVIRLLKHKHLDGEIVTPLDRRNGEGAGSTMKDYF